MKYILLKLDNEVYKQLAKLKIEAEKNWTDFFLDNYMESSTQTKNDEPKITG